MVKNQSTRLTDQHKITQGVVGIFGTNAKKHDLSVGDVSPLSIHLNLPLNLSLINYLTYLKFIIYNTNAYFLPLLF